MYKSETEILETAIDHLAEKGFFIWDDFITKDEVSNLINTIKQDKAAGEFKKAGIGKQVLHQVDSSIRGDYIEWVDRQHPAPVVQKFINKMDELRTYINQTCYLGLKDFECHFAIYPEKTFYKKHIDRFQQNAHRVLSFVLYLNENWQKGDGGELGIYPDKEEHIVEPIAGRLILFRSEILHEVLLSHKERISLTGWMLDKDMSLTFLQ